MKTLKSRAVPPTISVSNPRSDPRPAPAYQELWRLRRFLGSFNLTTSTGDVGVTLSSIKIGDRDLSGLTSCYLKNIAIWGPIGESTGTSITINARPMVVTANTPVISSLGDDTVTAFDMGTLAMRPAVRFNIPAEAAKQISTASVNLLILPKDNTIGYYTVEIEAYIRV